MTFKNKESFVVFLGKAPHSHNVTLLTGVPVGFCGVRLWYPAERHDTRLEWTGTISRPMPQDTKGKLRYFLLTDLLVF